MKLMLAGVIALMLLSSPVFAQESASDQTAVTKDDVERLFTKMHIREQMHRTMEMMMVQMKQIADDNLTTT
jgi:hypothetical protein